jgi:tripartite ATP-independent transporter DctM subunit
MSLTLTGIIGIIILLILLFSRMPVGFVMAFVGFLGFGYVISLGASMTLVSKDVITTFSSYDLSVMPLFVLMGQLAFEGGLAVNLYDAAYKILGKRRGGLGMATIGASALFAAICGSTNASAATMATVSEPSVRRFKYDRGFAAATVAAGGSLGILIPPSIVLIIYGIITETDISKLFAAGIFPGILLSILFIISIGVVVRIKPALGPMGVETSLKEKMLSLLGIIDPLILFFFLMGGLLLGFFTPTEAGAFGAFGVLVFLLFRKRLSWQVFVKALNATMRISCMVYIIASGAIIFGHFLAITRIPFELAGWIEGLNLSYSITFAFILFVYIVGGCFMDSLALILLTIPIFFPMVTAMGYDPIWFGVVIILIAEIGVITPPVGINVYIVEGVTKVPLEEIFKHIIPFFVALILCIVLLIVFPKIALFLPGLMS